LGDCSYSFLQKPILLKVDSFMSKDVPMIKFLTSNKVLENAIISGVETIGVYISIEEVINNNRKEYYTIANAYKVNERDGNVWWELPLPLVNYSYVDYKSETSIQGYSLPKNNTYNLKIRLLNSSYIQNLLAIAPSISIVSTTVDSVIITLQNNCLGDADIYYEIDDATPDLAHILLRAGQVSENIEIGGLSTGSYTIYAQAHYGLEESTVTEASFSIRVTVNPSIEITFFNGTDTVKWLVTNEDTEAVTVLTGLNEADPHSLRSKILPGDSRIFSYTGSIQIPGTANAKATAVGSFSSSVVYATYGGGA